MSLVPAAVFKASNGVAVKVPVQSVTVPSKVAGDPHEDKVKSMVAVSAVPPV